MLEGFFSLLVVGWAVGGWMMARKHGLCADQAPSVKWRIDASWGEVREHRGIVHLQNNHVTVREDEFVLDY
jgi:hypothetical protein